MGRDYHNCGKTPQNMEYTGLIRSSGEAAVEIHGQALVEDDGNVAGAGLHLTRSPTRDAGNL